jgi:hypothetical protein
METSTGSTGGDLREELRSDASTITDSAKQRLHSEVDARKGTAAEQAKSISSALDTAAGELKDSPDWLQSMFRKGAQTVQQFADTIDQKDSQQLTRDVQQMARTNPATFLGACALAGFAAARVLKAGTESSSGSYSNSSGGFDQSSTAQYSSGQGSTTTGSDFGRQDYGASSAVGGTSSPAYSGGTL